MDRAPLTALLAVTGLQFARDMKLQQVQLKTRWKEAAPSRIVLTRKLATSVVIRIGTCS